MTTEPSKAPFNAKRRDAVLDLRARSRGLRSGKAIVAVVAAALVALVVGGCVVYWQSQKSTTGKDKAVADIVPQAKHDAEPDDNSSSGADSQDGSVSDGTDDPTANGSPLAEDLANVEAVDPAEAKRLERIAKIKSGKWTTRQMLALSAARPYMIDFHVSINGQSLETAEREQIDAIADQLLRPTNKTDAPMQSNAETNRAMRDAGDGPKVEPDEQPDTRSPEKPEEQPDRQLEAPAADVPLPNMQEEANTGALADSTTEDPEADATGDIANEPLTWQELIEKPLVASGWLGNLIADDERSDQLISMYDSQRDDIVSRDELREFLSRGLSRRSALQVADIGNSPDSRDASPWGPLDTNEDYVLDAEENEQIMEKFMSLDRDGDGTLTLAEARPAMMAQAAMMRNTSVLSAKTLYTLESPSDSAAAKNRSRQLSNLAGSLIEHYTFLSELSAEQWPGYPEHRWKELDKDESGGVDRYEMRGLFDLPADLTLYLRFDPEFDGGYVVYAEPATSPSMGSYIEFTDEASDDNSVEPSAIASQIAWTETDRGGRLDAPGLCLQIEVEDLFTSTSRELVLSQVQMALKNPQLATALQTQFELSDEAIEFADQDGNSELSETEADALWQWLTARQGTRLAARWMQAPEPWFQLLDTNANNSIARDESEQFVASFQSTYGQGEAVLGAGDPLLVQFVVRRSDPRFEGVSNSQQNNSPEPDMALVDWFDAMDLDRDGAIDEDEFLGDLQDFTGLDANNDGFLRRAELYVPQASY